MGLLNCPECPTRPAIEDFPTKHACWKYYFAFENNFRFSPVFNTAHTLTPVICQLNYFLGSSRYCTYISTYIHLYTCDTYTIFISNKLFCLFDLAKKYHGCKTLAIETIADDSQCLQHKVGINKTQKWVNCRSNSQELSRRIAGVVHFLPKEVTSTIRKLQLQLLQPWDNFYNFQAYCRLLGWFSHTTLSSNIMAL